MSDVIDRIAKLMELSQSSNEHEAELAAKRAAELMARHQISMADLAASRGEAQVKVERGRVDAFDDLSDPSRVEDWHRQLVAAIAHVCGARSWVHGRGKYYRMFVVGPQGSPETVRYLYMVLSREIQRRASRRMREHGESNAWRRAYARGAVARVFEKLKEGRAVAFAVATSTALVVVDKTKAAVEEAYGELELGEFRNRPKKRPDGASWGYVEAEDIDVSSPASRLGEGHKKLKEES